MEKKVYEILANVLNIAQEDTHNLIMQECPQWSSLAHIDIVMSIEEEFDVSFEVADLPTLNSTKNIIAKLKELKNA